MVKPILPALLSCTGTRLSETEKTFFHNANPLGISLFGRNIDNKNQLKVLVQEIKDAIGRNDVLIAIDQEGGRVRRLKEPEFRSYAAAITLGALPAAQAIRASALHAALIASDLQEIGINTNFSPVLDLIYPQTTTALKSRCFSDNPQVVASLARAQVEAYIKGGIAPCLKHLPGHGRATTDPHLDLPKLDEKLSELQKDFYPFKQLKDCPLGMTAHIVIEAVDPDHPVTQSKKAIQDIIRGEIGFDGLLISDAIDMRALKGSSAEKARISLEAGCDAICYVLGDINEMQMIAANCPPMSDKSLERYAAATKIIKMTSQPTLSEKLSAEYSQLTGLVAAYQETYDATEVLHQMQNQT